MEIKNRNVQNPNRRILNVLKTNKNENGEIVSFEVEMFKDEGEVYEQGFALNAENLNALIQGYKISSTEDVWTEDKKSTEVSIDTFRPCNIEVLSELSEYINYSVNQVNDRSFMLSINANSDFEAYLSTLSNVQIELSILIFDQISEQKIGLVNYTITYVSKSETVID